MTDGGAFRRRFLIVPAPGAVTAELEDDYHRMSVTLHHRDGIVARIEGVMHRYPWTTCPGAPAELDRTFAGRPVRELARFGAAARNCTHLHDLSLFAAAHADDRAATAYDVRVGDPVDGRQRATLALNGALLLDWVVMDRVVLSPAELAGLGLRELNGWMSTLDDRAREAARILRWATIMSMGRRIAMPGGISAAAFAGASCYTYQADRAAIATRLFDTERDFSGPGVAPLGAFEDYFASGADER